MNKLNVKQMPNLTGTNSRNHAGVGNPHVQQYNQWFKDTLRISNSKIGTVNTPSRTYRGQALASMETPSTLYTTPKHTPLTARGSKAHDAAGQAHQQSNKTINDHAAGNILKNGIKVLGESPMKTIQIDLTPRE